MIRYLDLLLRDLLVGSIAELVDESQVSFRPPDDDWIAQVASLTVDGSPVNALNVYLIELRENRKLRSNEVVRSVDGGLVSETLAPMRLDCHYLVTAWSAASVSPAVEPAWDEHALLYEAAAALSRHDPLVPEAIYGAAGLGAWPAGFPDALRDAELPLTFVPADGFPKIRRVLGDDGRGTSLASRRPPGRHAARRLAGAGCGHAGHHANPRHAASASSRFPAGSDSGSAATCGAPSPRRRMARRRPSPAPGSSWRPPRASAWR